MVLCPAGKSGEHLAAFVGGKLPIVLVDRFFPDLPLPYVSSDNVIRREAGDGIADRQRSSPNRLSARHHGTSPNESRVRGYKEALAQHHLPIERT